MGKEGPYFARSTYPDPAAILGVGARIATPPRLRGTEKVLSLPFVEVPARGQVVASEHVQVYAFKAKRFVIYADDAAKLRVRLMFCTEIGGAASPTVDMSAAVFSDGPTNDLAPLVLHCSECGAPTEQSAPKCGFCGSPFTWRLTEAAYGMVGLALDFPPLQIGMMVEARFTNRSDKPIGVDCAFVGEAIDRVEVGYGG